MEKEDLKSIEANVKLLLTKYPELRSPFKRKQAHIKYWQEFEGVGNFGITLNQYLKLTSAETISRAIRKVQQENPSLRPLPEEELKKYEKANLFREYYGPNKGGKGENKSFSLSKL